MFGIEWIKRLVSRKPTPVFGMGDGSNVALSHITINKDGSNEEFVFGTVKYEDGCEPDGGHKPVTTIVLGTVGGQSPSTALAMVRQMTPEQIEAHIKCFDPAGAKLLEDVFRKAREADSKVSATKLAQMHRTSVVEIQQRLIDLGYIEDKSGLHYFTERGRDVGGEYRKNHPEASNADGFMVWPADLSI